MSVLHETDVGVIVLHEFDAPGWLRCPYSALDRIRDVTNTVRDQLPWCQHPEHEAVQIVLGPPAQA